MSPDTLPDRLDQLARGVKHGVVPSAAILTEAAEALHLWRPIGQAIPTPPAIFVGLGIGAA